jgi:hypothetical protein
MAQSIEQLGFELTADALAEQERALSGLRTRASTVLAAASIAGSFLGAKNGHGSLDAWGIMAMISFILCVGGALWVLLPHRLVFALDGKALLAEGDHQQTDDVTAAYRAIGTWIEPHLRANHDKIAWLADCLSMSCALLAAEIILWTLSLIG